MPTAASPIPLPSWLSAGLDSWWKRGVAAAGTAPVTPGEFQQWAVSTFPVRPAVARDRNELGYMHRLAARRTPRQTVTARWLAADGDKAVWQTQLDGWKRTVTPAQAAWGQQLLNDALEINSAVNGAAKERYARTRPYTTDPTIAPVVPLSNAGSPSYPSGHSARAFLEATILSALIPQRRSEFMGLAHQMAMARVYGGVHYPTDVMGGAWEGALIGSWLLRTHPKPPD